MSTYPFDHYIVEEKSSFAVSSRVSDASASQGSRLDRSY